MSRQNTTGRAALGGSQNTISLVPGDAQQTHGRSFGSSYYVAWMVRLMLSVIEEAWGFGGSRVALCGEETESQTKPVAGLPVPWP